MRGSVSALFPRHARRPFARVLAVLALVLASASTVALLPLHEARAADAKIEGAAKKLQTEAMDVDFLGLDLKKARDKLSKALKSCGKDKCGKPLLAALHRDLGIVLINSGEKDAGSKEFAAAIAADPAVTIGKDYLDNAEVKKAWEAAKKTKSATPTPTPTPTTTGEPATPTVPPPSAEGALTVKVAIAPTHFELPIVIEIPSGLDVAAVKVSYKTDAMDKYRPIEAKKQGGKWVVVLPCDVTAKPGTIKYYVKAYDEANAELEHYGTIKKPAQIKVVEQMGDDQEAPTLPGGKEPKECGDAAAGGGKPESSGCKEDDECEKGLVCIDNEQGKKWCKAGEKKPEKASAPKLWFGLDGQIDLVFLSAEKDLCKLDNWTCTADVNGERKDIGISESKGVNVAAGTGGKTEGGMAVATKRVFLSLDYFIASKVAIGARLGYIFGGNPTDAAKFTPFHAEVRLSYFITEDTETFRPYFMVNGGYANRDAPVPNVIVEPNDSANANACSAGGTPPACEAGSRPILKGVTGYKLVGPAFVGAGLGVWILPTPKFAVNIAMNLIFPLPVFHVTLSPEIGVKFAF